MRRLRHIGRVGLDLELSRPVRQINLPDNLVLAAAIDNRSAIDCIGIIARCAHAAQRMPEPGPGGVIGPP